MVEYILRDGEGNGTPLQYSCLENPVDRGAWQAPVHSIVAQTVKPAMRETWVRSLGREDPLEKGMATHSSTLAWKIPWTEKPGGLQSIGSQRVRHNEVTGTPVKKRTFFWCWFQKVLQVLIELFSFSFFSISGWGLDLDSCDTVQNSIKIYTLL